jgi:hypothetical protein
MADLRADSPAVIDALIHQKVFRTDEDRPLMGVTNPLADDPFGNLPEPQTKLLRQHLTDARVSYVVYSDDTVIAYVLDGRTAVMPDFGFYGLTSRQHDHQQFVREHLISAKENRYWVTWDCEGSIFDRCCATEAERDARILELVKSYPDVTNVRVEIGGS